ncbi:MAG: transglutaminase domain-containing protein [archaeon]
MSSNIKTPGIAAITILIITLLLSETAFAVSQDIKDPANIGELKVKINQYGKIIVPSGKLEWVKINLTFPQDNSNQEVITDEKYSEDELGNNILTIKKEKPGNIITYDAESIVTIKERRTLYIPETYKVPDDIKTYLEPTENIQSDNPEIANLATELTKDSKTDFKRIASLATWVHDNVEYTLSLGTEAKDALWTLENKVGTCDEFASLFIALARAAGYPARYISGHAYGKDGWEKHAFAEVYIGRWIPVDPTWNEVGNLDATHIQFTTKKDNIVKNEIQVYGTKISDMDWAEDETNIQILEVKEKEKENDYELIKSSDKLQAGEEAAVILRFTPMEYKVIKLDLEPCISTIDIVEIEDKEKSVILEPDKEKIVYWKIKVSDNLKKNMEYTCPLTLNSRLLSTRATNMTINTLVNQKPDEVTLYTELDKTDLILGEQQTIKIEIVKTQGSNPVTIGIIHGNEHIEKTVTLSPRETAGITHTFTPEETGEQEILVYASTGTIKTTRYKVGKNGDIYMDKIEIPEYAKTNEEIPISILIKNNRNTPETIKFTTTSESNTDMISTRIEKETYINTTATYSTTGDKKLSFHLSGDNVDTRTTRNIRIYEKPEIEIKTTYDYKKT